MRHAASGRLRKIRRRREENAPPFARNRIAKGRPPGVSRAKGAATRLSSQAGLFIVALPGKRGGFSGSGYHVVQGTLMPLASPLCCFFFGMLP